jgi:hypothetical protein
MVAHEYEEHPDLPWAGNQADPCGPDGDARRDGPAGQRSRNAIVQNRSNSLNTIDGTRTPASVALVQSSLRVIAIAMTAPEVIWTSGPFDREFRHGRTVKSLGCALDDFPQVCVGPPCLQQKITSPAKCQQSAFDRVLRMLSAGSLAKALGDNRAYRRKRVLDAVMEFFRD